MNVGRISLERAECHEDVYLVARRPGSPWERA